MSFLHQKAPKRWKLQGWEEPIGTELARNATTIVIKTKGYSSNHSGVRGMRLMEYEPAKIRVWTIIEDDGDTLEVEELISYPVKDSASGRTH